jgi:hypothetical protein
MGAGKGDGTSQECHAGFLETLWIEYLNLYLSTETYSSKSIYESILKDLKYKVVSKLSCWNLMGNNAGAGSPPPPVPRSLGKYSDDARDLDSASWPGFEPGISRIQRTSNTQFFLSISPVQPIRPRCSVRDIHIQKPHFINTYLSEAS